MTIYKGILNFHIFFIIIAAVMAGGYSCLNEEQGFAEDCILDGYQIIENLNVNKNDFVLGTYLLLAIVTSRLLNQPG